MNTRLIGSLEVSELGLGCNNFARKIDQAASTEVVRAALESGITFFDTADRYGYGDHPFSGPGRSEEFLGKALGALREGVVVATKFGLPMSDDPADAGGGRDWIHRACEQSLRRLGTEYIDLYMIHFPDPAIPVEETLGALTELVQAGKVREIGCSNFTAELLREAESISRVKGYARFGTVENEYSLLRKEAEQDVLPLCEEYGIAFLPYFPLASGLLTGRYSKNRPPPPGSRLASWTPRDHFALTEETLDRVERWAEFAAARGRTVLDLAIAWLLSNPLVPSVIAGATSPDQVRINAAATQWTLTRAERAEVAALN
ncbi:MAG TPA: aldo/keto reductase [Acidimicrobiia bacterium]|nr:aldo/keto reductase [Acidimicrobiia bacterium]